MDPEHIKELEKDAADAANAQLPDDNEELKWGERDNIY